MTWSATVFPAPLAWGAAFDPGLVEEMAGGVAASLRRAGAHQGLAPVLDVTRNLVPAALGPREFADVVVEPFVMALREGGARGVMHAYTDVDGVPPPPTGGF